MERFPEIGFITQHNDANTNVHPFLRHLPNYAALFDASSGRGKLPDEWLAPLHGVACGYSGGLGPDNLEGQLPKIVRAAGQSGFWIDMEGKLRDKSDRFDLSMAQRVLSIIKANPQWL